MNRKNIFSRLRLLGLAAALTALATFVGGCNDAQAGSLLGAGIGALAGQAIGGNTTGTLIGTGVGAGVGYIIGNESDKEKTKHRGNYDY